MTINRQLFTLVNFSVIKFFRSPVFIQTGLKLKHWLWRNDTDWQWVQFFNHSNGKTFCLTNFGHLGLTNFIEWPRVGDSIIWKKLSRESSSKPFSILKTCIISAFRRLYNRIGKFNLFRRLYVLLVFTGNASARSASTCWGNSNDYQMHMLLERNR